MVGRDPTLPSRMQSIRFSDLDIETLTCLIQECEQAPVSCTRELSGIWIRGDRGETELRLLILSNLRVTISKVRFVHRRQGTMTKVYKFLEDFCHRNEIPEMVVQCVQTEEMQSWCNKMGFDPAFELTIPMGGDFKKVISTAVPPSTIN